MQRTTCIFVCWLLLSSHGYAQSDWTAVTAIAPGTPLRIELDQGRYAEGGLQAADDTQVTLLRRARTLAAPRADVRKIERLGARKTAKRAGWGFLIGTVGGAILGYSVTETNRGAWAARMAVGWGDIAGLIGTIDGFHARERILLYRSP